MAISVTPNAITGLFTDKLQAADGQHPVVQVLDIKEIPAPANAASKGPRYRLVVSDGDAFLQAMAGSETAALIVAQTIKTYALLQLKGYTMNQVGQKRVLVIISVDVVGQLDKKIGSPVAVDKAEAKADGDAAMPAAPASNGASAAAAAGAGARPAAAAAAAAPAAKPFASPPAKAGGASQASPATQLAREGNVRPISSLNPYQRGWAIKARVAAKSGERTWSSQKGGGSGKLMSVDLVDSHGGQIRATMFNAAVDKFAPILQEKGVYIIAKGVLKVANARFNKLPNDYEITLNEDAEVVPVADAGEIKMQQFDFVKFSDIQDVKADAHIDILGVVVKAGDASEITGRTSGKQMMRRALTLVDNSGGGGGKSIELTLWGDDAKNYDKSKLNDEERPILAVKAVRVSDFGGKSLSTSFQSRIYVNPTDVAEAVALRQWYDSEGKDQTPSFMSGERQGSTSGPAPRKTFSAIKDEKLGLHQVVQNPNTGKPGAHARNGDYFTVRGTVVYYRSDMSKPPYYLACPTDKCGRKVTEQAGVAHCANCNKNVTPSPRYILSLLACDHTGGYWLTAFNEQAQKMLGRPAKDLHDIKLQGNEDEFKAVFAARNFLPFVFRVRAQEDMGRDGQGSTDPSGEQRVRVHVMDAQPLEGRVLVAEMQQMIKDLEATLGPL